MNADLAVLVVFAFVYSGMILGRIPGLALDRTGVALSSTLAGNLFIVGSIANIIVVDQAGRHGVTISWRDHARVGVPVTALTLAIAAGWLALRSF